MRSKPYSQMIVIVELRQGTVLDDSAILPYSQDLIVALLLDEKKPHVWLSIQLLGLVSSSFSFRHSTSAKDAMKESPSVTWVIRADIVLSSVQSDWI